MDIIFLTNGSVPGKWLTCYVNASKISFYFSNFYFAVMIGKVLSLVPNQMLNLNRKATLFRLIINFLR